jgi:SP family myo-inositol transporter-like MFS transporter 13
MGEMEEAAASAGTIPQRSAGQKLHDSLLRRKYVIPFLLACIILFCNTATGVNSIIGYNTGILLQSGLSDLAGALGLRDLHRGQLRHDHGGHDAGRSQGAQVPAGSGHQRNHRLLISVGSLFPQTEKQSLDCRSRCPGHGGLPIRT